MVLVALYHPWPSYSTRYRATERDTIEFEDLVTSEKRAVSVLILPTPAGADAIEV